MNNWLKQYIWGKYNGIIIISCYYNLWCDIRGYGHFWSSLASTIGSLKSGFKGQGLSQITMLFAKMIIVPLILIGLAAILPFGNVPEIRMAVCVVALTAGAPFIPGVTKIGKGNIEFARSASMLLTIITFILLPFTLPAALNLLNIGATASIPGIAWPIFYLILIPLIAGILIRARYPELAMQISSYLRPVSITSLLLHVTMYIAATWALFTSLYLTGVFIFALSIPILSIIIGYLLISPSVFKTKDLTNSKKESKITSLVSTSLSNTGVTILVAIFVLPTYMLTGVAILVFGLATIAVTVLTMAEQGKRMETTVS